MTYEHDGLIHKIALRVCRRTDPLWDDLIQELRLVCVLLQRSYKPEKNVPFQHYAWRKLASKASEIRRKADAAAYANVSITPSIEAEYGQD
jgi:DNA-directed RNA polymerase specialized sigma subunit